MVRDEYKTIFVESIFYDDLVKFFKRKNGALLNKLLSDKLKTDKEENEIIGAMKECRNIISIMNEMDKEVKDAR